MMLQDAALLSQRWSTLTAECLVALFALGERTNKYLEEALGRPQAAGCRLPGPGFQARQLGHEVSQILPRRPLRWLQEFWSMEELVRPTTRSLSCTQFRAHHACCL